MGRTYAILGDIHANIDALDAVLADARSQGVTDYISVGDVVGYNAAPAECIRVVRDELKCPVVRGNHDPSARPWACGGRSGWTSLRSPASATT